MSQAQHYEPAGHIKFAEVQLLLVMSPLLATYLFFLTRYELTPGVQAESGKNPTLPGFEPDPGAKVSIYNRTVNRNVLYFPRYKNQR